MKTISLLLACLALAAVSAQAQGTIRLNNTSLTKISTNNSVGGTSPISGQPYRFAFYASTTASSVNGQTAQFAGTNNVNYAFSDANWTLIAYGTNNNQSGMIGSTLAGVTGASTVSNLPSGTVAQFVVIGWSANIGTSISAVQSWFNGGSPSSPGLIGQSDVSGALTLGFSAATAPNLFSSNAPSISGFVLGQGGASSPSGNAPVITVQPTYRFVTVTSNATFSVTATGTPSPSYQWSFNGNPINGATSSTYTITGVQSTDAGYYSVQVTNTAGSTNSISALLYITYPGSNAAPFITSQPGNRTNSAGDTAIFSVLAIGTPAPSYQWFYNGNAINGATSQAYDINNVQLTDAGYYSVQLTNSAGATNSITVSLTVNGANSNSWVAPYFSSPLADKSAVVGSNTSFSITANGTPAPSYQWFFNSNAISGAIYAYLSLSNVQLSSAGYYSVQVTNVAGATNSRQALLTVTTNGSGGGGGSSNSPAAPIITAQPGSLSLPGGATATFSVSATGYPSPTYQWQFNSNNIPGATHSTLSINNISSTNAGNYAVIISNSSGSTNSATATLSIIAPNGTAYVIFANTAASNTRIYTNSTVGGHSTGLIAPGGGLYNFALYCSTSSVTISGQSSNILGAASTQYAFNDANWTLVAYGTNTTLGRFASANTSGSNWTTVTGLLGASSARFAVIGWSGNIGTDIPTLQSWFNNGSPASNGWIGQSAVSGSIILGDGNTVPTPCVFGTPPALAGFTLGLASPNSGSSYSLPPMPPAFIRSIMASNMMELSWPSGAGSFGVQLSDTPAGPWTDTGWTVLTSGTNSYVTVPPSDVTKFFRLVAQ